MCSTSTKRVERAHPRSRGDHSCFVAGESQCSGSSPLARGPLRLRVLRGSMRGLIPARAGNTIAVVLALDEIGAHPRSRGEHESYGEMSAREAGSSPLARGTRGGVCPRGSLHRAHPRSRGEHMRIFYAAFPVVGSSPLARGTHCPGGYLPRARGLIPARAGNTILSPKASAEIGAHPRSRGEHILALHHLIAPHGSSPLARGTLWGNCFSFAIVGLIPARAGNTWPAHLAMGRG